MTNLPPPAPLPYASPHDARTCPRCGQPAAKPVKFTWWGGLMGPRMLNHHKCHACGYTFNGKTGLPNTTAITLYLVAGAIIGLAAGFAVFFLLKF